MPQIFNTVAVVEMIKTEIQHDIDRITHEVLERARQDIDKAVREAIAKKALAILHSRVDVRQQEHHLIITIHNPETVGGHR